MVSTDGHRLCKVEVEVGEGLDIQSGVIIPKKGIIEIRKLLEGVEGTCDIGILNNYLFIRVNDMVISSKLVDAQFPPYQQVIPVEGEKSIMVNRITLLESMKRASIISSDKRGGIQLELNQGVMRIMSDNPDLGESQEDIEVDYDGKPLRIGFNSKYFVDLLGEMQGEQVKIELNGELDPGLIKEQSSWNYIGVIMPVRLS